MPNCVNPNMRRGFTLIEVLVSITLMAMISAVIVSALRSGFLAWDKGAAHIDDLRRARVADAILSDQIRGALPLAYAIRVNDQAALRPAFDGDHSGLRFVTRASFEDGPDAVPHWVDLRWTANAQSGAGAWTVEERRILPPDDAPDPTVHWRGEIMKEGNCVLDYLAAGRPGDPAKWETAWHYPDVRTLPRAVRISCTAARETARSVIPLDYAASSAAGLTFR